MATAKHVPEVAHVIFTEERTTRLVEMEEIDITSRKVVDRAAYVALELTLEEAQTLREVLGSVGGSPSQSGRGFADSIYDALVEAGFSQLPQELFVPSRQSIYFEDGSRAVIERAVAERTSA